MHSIALEPNETNIKDSICNNTFHRNEEILKFIRFLQHIEGPYCYAIDDNWGNGKTFFVKETQMVMEYLWRKNYLEIQKRKNNIQQGKVEKVEELNFPDKLKELVKDVHGFNQYGIYYDAWQNDYHTNPLLSLILEITKQTQMDLGKKKSI